MIKRLIAYMTLNDVKSGDSDYYPEIQPVSIKGPLDDVLESVREAFLEGGDNWQIESVSDRCIEGVVETSIFGFKDDFTVKLREDNNGNEQSWSVIARSRSRVGEGDLGKNARNLKNFYSRLSDQTSEN